MTQGKEAKLELVKASVRANCIVTRTGTARDSRFTGTVAGFSAKSQLRM